VVIDFGDLPIFDATTYPSILLVEKGKPEAAGKTLVATFTDPSQLERLDETLAAVGFSMPIDALKAEGWTLERPDVLALMEKLRKAGKPLGEYVKGKFYYGIKTGLNEAFVIDEVTRQQLIAEDPKSADLIKPWLRGRDIRKWKAEWAGLYLLYVPWHFDLKRFPVVLNHLAQYRDQLENRNESERGRYEWYALQRYAADYYQEFEKPKIIWGNLATEPKFAFDSSANYVSAPANIIPTSDLYLLAVLNSPLCKWWISHRAAVRSGGFLEYKPMYVGEIPVYKATDVQKAPIIERIRAILADPDSPADPRLESEINTLIYNLYDLTKEEIAIVDQRVGNI